MTRVLGGFTRASSLGPIAAFMEQQGGCASRIFRKAGLPTSLLIQPDVVIPLQAQFQLLEFAARETGDTFFGARLGQVVRVKDLSAFGTWVCESETLSQAIDRCNSGLSRMLQTGTRLELQRHGSRIQWSIEFLEPQCPGRRHNEFLGLSYMIDAVRSFAGSHWRPEAVMAGLPVSTPRMELENIFRTNVSNGHRVPAIEFDAALLGARRPATLAMQMSRLDSISVVPPEGDFIAGVKSVIELALCDGYPRIDWVGKMLGVSRRNFQRSLAACGTNYNSLVEAALLRRAKALLDGSGLPITEIALELGYNDPAHFTRAFKRWMGITPSAYRVSPNECERPPSGTA